MIFKIFSPDLSNKEQLHQLVILRQFYLLCEVMVVAFSQWYFVVDLPWHSIWAMVFGHIVLTVGYYWHSQTRDEIGVSYLVQTILIDILAFTALLYFSGGVTNGAISILLMPVATAAALFRWRLSLPLAVLAIICYSWLMLYYQPIGGEHESHNIHLPELSAHLIAMWLTFIFSCLLLVWFIGLQANAVREKNAKLAALREKDLRNEQLIAIATFAANAAHDLATPLSSISLLCDEVKEDCSESINQEGIDTLIKQVELCRSIVQSISHKAIQNHSQLKQDQLVDLYFKQLIERWLVTRPEINLSLEQQFARPQMTFRPDPGLESAITNILDNAANASIANRVNQLNLEVAVTLKNEIKITVIDFGSGIDDELIDKLGKAPVSSKADGMGLGQFLANSTIERNGGHVWRKSSATGTETLITLPLKKMSEG